MTTQNSHLTPEHFAKNADLHRSGMVGEFIHFMMRNKKWWLLPIVLILLLLGVLVVLGGTAAAPFIYTLF
jgi:Family of unknown function (DUF5989)